MAATGSFTALAEHLGLGAICWERWVIDFVLGESGWLHLCEFRNPEVR